MDIFSKIVFFAFGVVSALFSIPEVPPERSQVADLSIIEEFELKPIQPTSISQMIQHSAKQRGVDPKIALNIARCESGLNPDAKNASSSASGLFQLLKEFRNNFCPEIDPFDPVQNTECALNVMKDSLNHWGESFQCWKKI